MEVVNWAGPREVSVEAEGTEIRGGGQSARSACGRSGCQSRGQG